jgi:hypothetical protein
MLAPGLLSTPIRRPISSPGACSSSAAATATAVVPVTFGMSSSRIAKLGSNWRIAASACSPSTASATPLKRPSACSTATRAERTSGWSSATTTEILGLSVDIGVSAEPTPSSRPGLGSGVAARPTESSDG